MTSEHGTALWPDADRRVALRDLAELSGLSEAEVLELVEYGALAPADETSGQWMFGVQSIWIARTAHRLRVDFELEPHAVSLLLAYLDRIRELEAQVRTLRAQLPR
jgi:chaperone modulatory protein CbpM